MRNLFLLFLLVVSSTFIACNKDGDEDVNPDPFITATISGAEFNADVVQAAGDDSFGELIAFITGSKGSTGDVIGINVPASIPLNTVFEVDATDLGLTFTNSAGDSFITVGNLTVTQFDTIEKRVAGTFDFEATNDNNNADVRTITAGSFNIEYTE